MGGGRGSPTISVSCSIGHGRGLAGTPSGVRDMGRRGFRWCRCAQPPATGWHPVRDGENNRQQAGTGMKAVPSLQQRSGGPGRSPKNSACGGQVGAAGRAALPHHGRCARSAFLFAWACRTSSFKDAITDGVKWRPCGEGGGCETCERAGTVSAGVAPFSKPSPEARLSRFHPAFPRPLVRFPRRHSGVGGRRGGDFHGMGE